MKPGLRTDVDTVTGRVDAIIGTSPETLDTLQEIVAAFKDADSDLQAVISDNSGRLTVNERGDIDALEVRATDLESRATAVEGRATALETEQVTQNGRLTVNEGHIDTLEAQVGTGTLGTVATDLTAVNEIHAELDVEVGKVLTLESEMDAVEGRATVLEGEMDVVELRATAPEGRATVNEGDIDDLETKVGTATLATVRN